MCLPRWPIAAFALLGVVSPAAALGPDDVFLLVNQNVPASREIALHYCDKRGVPRDHIITLPLPIDEDISRQEFNTRLLAPLRAALKDRAEQAKVLLTVYGVPLRVGPAEPSNSENAQLAILATQIEREPDQQVKRQLEERRRKVTQNESQAAVDSELFLLWWGDYELRRWQLNPLYFQVTPEMRKGYPRLVMVARLDGPSPALITRMIDQAVEVEHKGLTGKVYVDARGITFDRVKDAGFGYGGYDESLREMAKLLLYDAKMLVTLDDRPELFAPGSCVDAALYCGWYSLANYVDCCRFAPGAVAYHIASSEAVSLRDPKARYWCKCLLENGAVATLGPVAEPYTLGFPKPAEFFGFLVTGRYTLVECYSLTCPVLSWMTVLVGDPLYNPYKQTPKLQPSQVVPSPKGTKLFVPKSP